MKKKYSFILLLIVMCSHTYAIKYATFGGNVISEEQNNINGSLQLSIKYTFYDTTTFTNNTEFELPQFWTASMNQNIIGNTYS